ncbi:GDP-mannose 4,6-dehydratase [Spirulina sp. CS-785/01]|uniref:GDP-mannose 4,6-dehydratase n=1 Tax=Spirulina sp. CS-785/01 TaxID=3021716 RepID=UPI00232CD70C|nr:GDP-mannose 4,6-dehydratase [Spirulina sp. CS-785/01]MDB9315251.1 GDP-mannose 4,6-dehydratase [Spirulina sp. CS-785/01]
MSKFWQDRPVFVTGCTGLLGSWLSEELCDRQSTVIGLIRDFVPQSRLFQDQITQQMTTVSGTVEDFPLLERTLNEYEIDTVFHLAAQTIVGIANRNPLSTFETNIKGTWTLLEACRRVPTVKRIIIASSDKAYGTQPTLPYTEDSPLQGQHPYDVSKSCADLITASYYNTYNLPVCITRCGNLYGGGDLNFNRLIPGTIRSILQQENPIIRSDGQYIRDYFYVKDAVYAYLELAEQMDNPDVIGKAFNFSNESQDTVLDVVNQILQVMETTDLPPRILNEAKHEIPHQYLSAKRAKTLLNWTPKYNLAQGLQETVTWYQQYLSINPQ